MRNAREGTYYSLSQGAANASLHYCGTSTRTCQNHVRPHPHKAENFLAMSFAIDDTQQAEQWTQHKGWNCEDWMGGDGFEEEE